MLQYRVFIKDCLDLSGMPIANQPCSSFTINRDLLTSARSNFEVIQIPDNIKEGDILSLVDPYGTILYTGVISSVDTAIETEQILNIFNDQWLWKNPSSNTIEGKLNSIITSDFINSEDPLIKKKFPFRISVESSTIGSFKPQENPYVINFMEFINELYDLYGVIVDIDIPFNPETPIIHIKKATHTAMKVGNNVVAVRNLTPFNEIFETNRLFIYNQEGTTLRGAYYGTTDGITTNANNPLRLPVVNTKYIFDSEETLENIKNENIQNQMYNHRITFDLILDNNLYNFFDWELGMVISIWYNALYYDSIFTGYSISKKENEDMGTVQITCGKVRNKLTEIINGYK